MAIIDILLPKMGESVAEATITKLVVEAGASVEADDPIVEIATDKVDSEVPAPEDGILVEWCIEEGDVVQVGAVIARYDIGAEGGATPSQTEQAAEKVPSEELAVAPAQPEPEVVASVMAPLEEAPTRKGPSGRFYSPLVRSIAQKEGIPMAELEKVSGTGSEGRVTKKDILAYVDQRKGEIEFISRGYSLTIACTSSCATPGRGFNCGCCQECGWCIRHRGDGQDAENDCGPHGSQRADESTCHFFCRSRCDESCDVAQCQQKVVPGKVWRKSSPSLH